MQQTLQLAESALEQGELPIAALVVLDDEIIAQATTGEKQQNRFLAHAEIQALDIVESKSDGAVALAQGWRRDESLFPGYQVPKVIGEVLREENGRLFQKYTQLHPPGSMVDWAKSIVQQIDKEEVHEPKLNQIIN